MFRQIADDKYEVLLTVTGCWPGHHEDGNFIVEGQFTVAREDKALKGTLPPPGDPYREVLLKNAPCIYTRDEKQAIWAKYHSTMQDDWHANSSENPNPCNCQCIDCYEVVMRHQSGENPFTERDLDDAGNRWYELDMGQDFGPYPPQVKFMLDKPVAEGTMLLLEAEGSITVEQGCETYSEISMNLEPVFLDGPMERWYAAYFERVAVVQPSGLVASPEEPWGSPKQIERRKQEEAVREAKGRQHSAIEHCKRKVEWAKQDAKHAVARQRSELRAQLGQIVADGKKIEAEAEAQREAKRKAWEEERKARREAGQEQLDY